MTNDVDVFKRFSNKISIIIANFTYRFFVLVLKILTPILYYSPISFWSFLVTIITPILWIVMKRRRRQAIRNLQTVLSLDLKSAKALGKASFHSNLLVLFESLVLKRILDQKGVTLEVVISPEAQIIIDDLRNGDIHMALALSSHSGVWELVGALLAQLVHPTPSVVASKLPRNIFLARFLKNVRFEYGLNLVDKNSFSRHILKQRREDSSFLNLFLCDQHFNRPGAIKVPFLGKSACTVGIPATIIQKYKTPTIMGCCIRKGLGDYLIEYEALDLEPFKDLSKKEAIVGITGKINDILSSNITRAPEQWTWGHRRWRDCCDR